MKKESDYMDGVIPHTPSSGEPIDAVVAEMLKMAIKAGAGIVIHPILGLRLVANNSNSHVTMLAGAIMEYVDQPFTNCSPVDAAFLDRHGITPCPYNEDEWYKSVVFKTR